MLFDISSRCDECSRKYWETVNAFVKKIQISGVSYVPNGMSSDVRMKLHDKGYSVSVRTRTQVRVDADRQSPGKDSPSGITPVKPHPLI